MSESTGVQVGNQFGFTPDEGAILCDRWGDSATIIEQVALSVYLYEWSCSHNLYSLKCSSLIFLSDLSRAKYQIMMDLQRSTSIG